MKRYKVQVVNDQGRLMNQRENIVNPADYFVAVRLPHGVGRALAKASYGLSISAVKSAICDSKTACFSVLHML